MPVVIVEAVAPIGSWRAPEAMSFHRTYPLPPYTALVGTLGAAFGLDLPAVYRLVRDCGLRLGVGGSHGGTMRDLWKFQKLELIADAARTGDWSRPTSAVLLREHLIDLKLIFVVETPEAGDAERVAGAFRAPSWPMTAGPSDALLKVLAVTISDAGLIETRHLAGTLICDEFSPLYEPLQQLDQMPLTRTVRPPAVESITTGFTFEDDGRRRLAGRATVSFVGDPIRLPDGEPAVAGYPVTPKSRPLSDLYESWRLSPWVIPVHRYS
jgi:CRISPR-associated protein Cas5t